MTDFNKLYIRQYPDPVLRATAAPVETFDDQLRALVEAMFRLMHEARGVGLAAPQVGVSLRLFVMNPTVEPDDDRVIINPQLTPTGTFTEAEEGCLSLPGVNVHMRRRGECRLQAVDLEGRTIDEEADGLVARIWQHETDHLDGRLIIDNMSTADELANRKVLKSLTG